jgi:hypothetical protein
MGEDQRRLGGVNRWCAAPLKVAIADELAFVHACGWPSEIWLTPQTVGVVIEDGLLALEIAMETVVELDVAVGLGTVADAADEEEEEVVVVAAVAVGGLVVVGEGDMALDSASGVVSGAAFLCALQ